MQNRLFSFAFLLLFLGSCTIGRMVVFNFSDIKDYKRFASRPLHPAEDVLHFKAAPQQVNKSRPVLDSLIANSSTVAFLVIRNDSLVYEKYHDGYGEDSWVASFSMAKSFTSALVGCAIEDGFIGGVSELVVDYIPELKKIEGWEDVTILHLLQMTSGAEHKENYFNPFAGVAKSYYGRNLKRQATKVKREFPTNTQFRYKSINTQLLGEIVCRSTEKSLTDYLQEKVWTPMGAEFPASWSLDKKRDGREKAFSSINATALDFAKFGRLYLHGGRRGEKQVIPADWVARSTALDDTDAAVNFYQYQWWIKGPDAFAAEGHLGQFIYVNRAKDLIMVRLGKNSGRVDWYNIFKQIADGTPA